MKYEIVSVNESDNSFQVYFVFHFPGEDNKRTLSFMHYIKKSQNFDQLFLIEVETGHAYKLSVVYDKICKKLEEALRDGSLYKIWLDQS